MYLGLLIVEVDLARRGPYHRLGTPERYVHRLCGSPSCVWER